MKRLIILFLLFSYHLNANAGTITTVTNWDATVGKDGQAGCPTNTSSGNPCYKDHPDETVACGTTYCVVSTGQEVDVYDKTGVSKSSTLTPAFINNTGLSAGAINDPRITYDTIDSLFLIVCSCTGGGSTEHPALFFISDSALNSNQSANWHGTTIDTTRNGDLTMKIGFDANGIYMAETVPAGTGSAFYAIPHADITSTSIPTTHLNTFTTDGPGTTLPIEMIPAIDRNSGKASGDAQPFCGFGHGQANQNPETIKCVRGTWSGNTFTLDTLNTITTSTVFVVPPNTIAQPSGKNLKAQECHRPYGGVVSGNQMYFAECNEVSSHTQITWYNINWTSGSPAVTDSGTIVPSSADYVFPSLDLDGSGDIILSFWKVSTSQDVSMYVTGRLTSDSAGTMNTPTQVKAGTQVYDCNTAPCGMGVFSSCIQDPSDTTKVWCVNQVVLSNTASIWQTEVGEFSFSTSLATQVGAFLVGP